MPGECWSLAIEGLIYPPRYPLLPYGDVQPAKKGLFCPFLAKRANSSQWNDNAPNYPAAGRPKPELTAGSFGPEGAKMTNFDPIFGPPGPKIQTYPDFLKCRRNFRPLKFRRNFRPQISALLKFGPHLRPTASNGDRRPD